MANLIMTNWYIEDKTPYINLGSAGENNARTITIQVDELIDGAEYYIDIGSENGDELPNTQLLTAQTVTTPSGDEIKILYFKPLVSFLGKNGVKLLQVRCVYTENDDMVVKESNVFHCIIDKNSGFIYKYNIAVFEQYIKQMKQLLARVNTNNNSGGNGNNTSNGDMNTSVYDINNNNVVDTAEKVAHTLTVNCNDETYVYDGSMDIEITVPSASTTLPNGALEELSSQVVALDNVDLVDNPTKTLNIEPNHYYWITDSENADTSVAQLSITFDTSELLTLEYAVPDFHFAFLSGSTPTQLILPNNVGVPSDFNMESYTLYDIKINPYIQTLTYTSRTLM